jgi:ComF family protein
MISSQEYGICLECINLLQSEPAFSCSVCHKRLPYSKETLISKEYWCHKKASHIIFSVSRYEDERIRNLISELKFKNRSQLAVPLALLLSNSVKALEVDLNQFVVSPIPLSAKRLRARGFNQSELIAQVFAREIKIPLVQLLSRNEQTKTQSEIVSWTQRRINIAGVFSKKTDVDVKDKKIILIDDVWTSGATMSEAVSVLKNAGAGEIIAVVVARAR